MHKCLGCEITGTAGRRVHVSRSCERGGGGSQQPPARRPSHPTTPGGAAEGGAQPSTPPAALHQPPRRRSQETNSQKERLQLRTAASGRCATRAGRQGGFGRRHAPPSHAFGEAGRRWAHRHHGEGPSAPRGPRWPVRHQGCRRVGDALLRTGRSATGCQAAASSPQPPARQAHSAAQRSSAARHAVLSRHAFGGEIKHSSCRLRK